MHYPESWPPDNRYHTYGAGFGSVCKMAGKLDWVIVGGESGPGYRPMDHEWARSLRRQCDAAGVPFFFKQSSAPRTEMGIELDGEIVRAWPRLAVPA